MAGDCGGVRMTQQVHRSAHGLGGAFDQVGHLLQAAPWMAK